MLEIPADSVKFNLEVYTWPFCGERNSLSLGVDVKEGRFLSQRTVLHSLFYSHRSRSTYSLQLTRGLCNETWTFHVVRY